MHYKPESLFTHILAAMLIIGSIGGPILYQRAANKRYRTGPSTKCKKSRTRRRSRNRR